MRKFQVECSWCFWNGSRAKSRIDTRCPYCRKSHTVELFDACKLYSPDELERYRKMKLVEMGGKEIRPGVWVSKKLSIYTSDSCRIVKKFDGYRFLYDILNKDSIAMVIGRAWRQGKKFVKIGDAFLDLRPHAKTDRK